MEDSVIVSSLLTHKFNRKKEDPDAFEDIYDRNSTKNTAVLMEYFHSLLIFHFLSLLTMYQRGSQLGNCDLFM